MDAPTREPLTAGQAGFFLAWACTTLLWAYAEVLTRRSQSDESSKRVPSVLLPKHTQPETPSVLRCGLVRCLTLQQDALVECRDVLRWCTELGAILTWFYVADRTPALPRAPKAYSRDVFGFLCLCVVGVSALAGTTPAKSPSVLSRGQTEEWKGWMQILFLLYHYFNAKELYNAIRVFIAAYVWMTGYGNFRYYVTTSDFTLGRMLQSLWRLNFLAAACCVVLNNSYMLYYICPMHTLFTLVVYGVLAVVPSANKTTAGITAKLVASVCLVAAVWEVPGVFDVMWAPLKPLLAYSDPRRPSTDTMHEWRFRSGLDRYVWIHGMLCGALQPSVDAALQRVDAATKPTRIAVRAGLVTAAAATLAVWARTLFTLPKHAYNAVHPYTSWIPITAWIVLRNAHPALRTHSSTLLAWCGTITLETYIAQFHTWMATDIADGQPKALLGVVPGAPLTSFAVASVVAVVLSRRLFLLTACLRDVVVPHAAKGTAIDGKHVARNVGVLAGVLLVAWAVGVLAVWVV